jgi:LacI family transcriptional regulator
MKKALTMRKIAEELGLSRVTVSSVINNKARKRNISQSTVERVQTYLKTRGYVPSRQARELRMGNRNTTGILHCGHIYSHLTEAFNKLVDHFSNCPQGVEIVVVRREHLLDGLRELVSRGIRKLIWIHTRRPDVEFEKSEEVLGVLSNVKTVIYNYRFDRGCWDQRLRGLGIYLVGANRNKAYQHLASLIKSLGHESVALCEYYESESMGVSDAEFNAAFKNAGLAVVSIDFPDVADYRSLIGGEFFARQIIQAIRKRSITAVCFLDDEVAADTMAELLKKGISIPGELSVTGFDGMRYTSALAVPLTTLKMPVEEMVDQTIRLMNKNSTSYEYCFELNLIERKSHGIRGK